MKYLSPEQILFIHGRVIDDTGGSHGMLNVSLLQSAAARPRATFEGRELYQDLFHKAAALIESLIKNHPFVGGNKRTAIASAGLFLRINGYSIETSQKELERFTLDMATGKASFDDAVKWFKNHARGLVNRK